MRSRSGLGLTLLFGAAALAIYVATAPPNIVVGDSPEFVVTISTLGVSHPPGYPLYHLVGKALASLFWFIPVARACNLASSLAAVATLIVAGLVLTSMGVRKWLVFVGLAALALSRTFWHFAVVTEVYMLNLLLFSLLAWLITAWHRDAGPRRLYFLAFVMGLALAHHTTMVIYFPLYIGIVAAELCRSPRPGTALAGGSDLESTARWRPGLGTLVKAIGLLAAPLALYAYLPLASARHPVMDWGRPDNLKAVIGHITAGQYRHLLWEYGWRGYADGLRNAAAVLARECHGLLGLAVVGAIGLARGRRRAALVLLAGSAAICVLAVSAYDIVDIEPYFLPGILAIYVLGIVGIDQLATWLRPLRGPRALASGVAIALASALVAVNLFVNARECNLSHSWAAHDFGTEVYRNLVSESGKPIVLFVRGDEMCFIMLYLGVVEKERPDVMVVADNYVIHPSALARNPANFEMYYSCPTSDALRGYKLVPWGLVYRVLPEADRRVYQDFPSIRIRGITDRPTTYAAGDLTSNLAGIYYYQKGTCSIAAGDRAGALASFEAVAHSNGDNPDMLYNLGLVYEEIGEWERALETYSAIVDLKGYTLLAKICRNRIVFANFMLSHYNPAYPEVRWTEYGVMLFKNAVLSGDPGLTANAIGALEQAISLNPKYLESYVVLANIYTALKQYDQAHACLMKAAELDPNDREVHEKLEDLERTMGAPPSQP